MPTVCRVCVMLSMADLVVVILVDEPMAYDDGRRALPYVCEFKRTKTESEGEPGREGGV